MKISSLSWAVLCIASFQLPLPSTLAQTRALSTDTYDVGGTQVVIPSPWKGMVEMGTDKRHFMDQFVPATNRLIAGYVSLDDLPAVRVGDVKAPERMAIVATSRQFESKNLTDSDFKQIIESVAKNFDTTVSGYSKYTAVEFKRRVVALQPYSPRVSFSEPISLGCLFSTPDSAAFGTILQASRVEGSGKSNGPPTLMKTMSVIYIRAKHHIVFGYIYADYKDKDTAIWLRSASESWADAILKGQQRMTQAWAKIHELGPLIAPRNSILCP